MSIIKHVTLQKIVAHDFRYDPRRCVDVAGSKQIPAKFHCGLSMKAVHKHCEINLTLKKVFHVVLETDQLNALILVL